MLPTLQEIRVVEVLRPFNENYIDFHIIVLLIARLFQVLKFILIVVVHLIMEPRDRCLLE